MVYSWLLQRWLKIGRPRFGWQELTDLLVGAVSHEQAEQAGRVLARVVLTFLLVLSRTSRLSRLDESWRVLYSSSRRAIVSHFCMLTPFSSSSRTNSTRSFTSASIIACSSAPSWQQRSRHNVQCTICRRNADAVTVNSFQAVAPAILHVTRRHSGKLWLLLAHLKQKRLTYKRHIARQLTPLHLSRLASSWRQRVTHNQHY